MARIEKDSLGNVEIADDIYYGIQTVRAIHNFPITGTTIGKYKNFIKALAQIKIAAARSNYQLGQLSKEKAKFIERAAMEIVDGKLIDQFKVDVIQGGAGTSTNVCADEIIANRALELMGKNKGEYQFLSPIDDVNMSQSTNDVYPSAIRLGYQYCTNEMITNYLDKLIVSFSKRAIAFDDILKTGRTQLQDAVPMTVRQEFAAFRDSLRDAKKNILYELREMAVLNMGGTAVGTGINTKPEYKNIFIKELNQLTGFNLKIDKNLIKATSDVSGLASFHDTLKRLAIVLTKIANDIRLLSSGPSTGFMELKIPKVQMGSTIMPGKVNPVIPEVVNQVAFAVMGYNTTVNYAASASQLQLNAMEPVIADATYQSIKILANAMKTFRINCINRIKINKKVLKRNIHKSSAIATTLNIYIGYKRAARLVREYLRTGESVMDIAMRKNLLTNEQITEIMDPHKLVEPNL